MPPLGGELGLEPSEVASSAADVGVAEQGESGPPIIFSAIDSGNRKQLKEALARNEIECVTASGATPLVYALQLNKPDVAEYLMTKATPDVRAATKVGDTALHWACYFGHTSIAGVLLALGADCNAVGDSGNRPLHLAASRGHVDIVAMLLIQGADTRFKNAFGISAATITANKKCQKLIQRVHEGGDGERSAIKAELEVEQAELRAKLEAELQLSNASKTEALEREQAAKARRQAEDDEEDRLDEVARLKREAEEAERRRQEELKRIEEEKERRRLEELKRKEKRAKRAAKKKGGDKGAKKK